MRYMTDAMRAQVALRGSTPLLLVTLSQNTPGMNRVVRLTSNAADGDNYTLNLSGGGTESYRGDLVAAPRVAVSMKGTGGIGKLSSGSFIVANPDETGDLWTDMLQNGSLDGAELAFRLLWHSGAETDDDLVFLGNGLVTGVECSVDEVRLEWTDTAVRKHAFWPGEMFTAADYPHAPAGTVGTVKPVVFGDMSGSAFDFTTPSDGLWRHVPCPQINAMKQQYFLRDPATASGQEDFIVTGGAVCRIPPSCRTLYSDNLHITGNVLHGWVVPHRVVTETGCDNAEAVRTGTLDDYAELSGTLEVELPGVSSSVGEYGASATPVAGDYTIYIVASGGTSSESADFTVTVNGTAVEGPNTVVLGTGRSVISYTVGDHLTGWSDVQSVHVKAEANTSAVRLHRMAGRVVFRSNDATAAFEELKVYRSQQGFSESISPSYDYQGGGFLLPSGRTTEPFRNPADQVEVLLRNRNWGLGLSAPSYTVSGSSLTGAVSSTDTAWPVSDGSDFAAGDVVLCDGETVRVTGISGDTLTVVRGCEGSRPVFHGSGTALYLVGDGGDVNIASFRGAAELLRHPMGDDLVTNGDMEAGFTTGVATGWTAVDPSGEASFYAYDGCSGRYGQEIIRESTGGVVPGLSQTLTTEADEWYLLGFRVKGSMARDAGVRIGTATASFSMTNSWQYHEFVFPADGTSTEVRLLASDMVGCSAFYDDIVCRKLSEWKWDHVVRKQTGSRAWLDAACRESGLRLIEDGSGRTAARVCQPFRTPGVTWGSGVIVGEVRERSGAWRKEPVRVYRTPLDESYTGVQVQYAYNHVTKEYGGVVDLRSWWENTGRQVTAYSGNADSGTLTASGITGLFPAGRWTSDAVTNGITVSGTSITITGAGFLTDGVESGDWLHVRLMAEDVYSLAVVRSVDSETTLTLAEPMPCCTAVTGTYSVFPCLFSAGGAVFLPHVPGGPGSHGTTFTAHLALESAFGAVTLPTGGVPQAGDKIWMLYGSSNDGEFERDQIRTVYDNRERRALVRLAASGNERLLSLESRCIQERETAVALRNQLFDSNGRRYLVELTTDLSTVGTEISDAVAVEHDLVPGGGMTCEVLRQDVDIEHGVIRYLLQELRCGRQ